MADSSPFPIRIPVHGNWCGPGHTGGDVCDALDAACKAHDECYRARGYFDCDCDKQLYDRLTLLIASGQLSPATQFKAYGIKLAFGAKLVGCGLRKSILNPLPLGGNDYRGPST